MDCDIAMHCRERDHAIRVALCRRQVQRPMKMATGGIGADWTFLDADEIALWGRHPGKLPGCRPTIEHVLRQRHYSEDGQYWYVGRSKPLPNLGYTLQSLVHEQVLDDSASMNARYDCFPPVKECMKVHH